VKEMHEVLEVDGVKDEAGDRAERKEHKKSKNDGDGSLIV